VLEGTPPRGAPAAPAERPAGLERCAALRRSRRVRSASRVLTPVRGPKRGSSRTACSRAPPPRGAPAA